MEIPHKVNILWCRAFQSVLKIGNYFMGYRMPEYMEGSGKVKELGSFLKTKKVNDMDVATRVSVQLQLTDPTARSRDRIIKKSEKAGLYTALDFGCVWLERALAGK